MVGVRPHLWPSSGPRDRDCDQDTPQRAGHGETGQDRTASSA